MDFGTVITAMATPMDANRAVDYDGAQRLAEYLLANGSDALVVCGTTGESPTLSKEEKLKMFAAVLEVAKGKAPVIAGTSTYDTAASVELSKKAEALGVDGLLTVTPYYNKPPQEGVFQHLQAIAQAVSLPVILYNVPSRTNVNLMPQTVARLAQIENVVAVKEASSNPEQVMAIRQCTPPDFIIYSGDDAETLHVLELGGIGVISVASHLVGKQIKEMIDCYNRDDMAGAQALHEKYGMLFKKMFLCANPIPLKFCLNQLGLPAGPCRLPLCEASADIQEQLVEMLRQYELQ
ncbi:MAG: 4-hydroxy-tetrahydrodipicolinate synthase [Firmicutes bacterium]|nr:4-hydroxy-tetrahydrodipicolinate synthase [Bacillota bacterium]